MWIWWLRTPFNGNTQDESGNNYHVQSNTATLTADRFGKPNAAYHFDGTSAFMEVPVNAPFVSPNHTISAWVRTVNSVGYRRVVALPKGGGQHFSLNVNTPTTKKASIYFDKAEGGGGAVVANSAKDVTDGNWHHLVGVINMTDRKMSMYVDGTIENTINLVNTAVTTTEVLQIGRFTSTQPEYFDGDIDDIKIYSRALSESEVEQLYGNYTALSAGLLAYYPLNNNVLDIGPNGLHGDPSNISYIDVGNGLKAAKFNGTTSAIVLAHTGTPTPLAKLSPSRKFTVSAWFQDGFGLLVINGPVGYKLRIKKGVAPVTAEVEGGLALEPATAPSTAYVINKPILGNFPLLQLVTFTFDGANLALYHNGRFLGSSALPPNLANKPIDYSRAVEVAIGRDVRNREYFKGLIQ